ncbi:hypothetical protein [Solitalea lacus]|uniref:hypothetical protein n=1 Tax=Solitalea lacus TaxID=2911172 RepID=UPI001EDAB0AF|nr:hypothetical protein [Solitalea lacus]UKJ08798.1 hypothetical protein L2B55_06430 [Solitalea lacus]
MIKGKDSRIELYYDDQDRLIRDVFYNKSGLKEFTRTYIGNTIQTRDRIYFLNDKKQVIDIKSANNTYLSKIAFESNGNIVSYREYYLGKLKSSTDYSYDNKNHPMLNVLGREYLFFVMEDSGYNLGYILDCNTLVNNVVEQQDDKGTKQQWITKLNYRYNESSFPTYRTDELEEIHYSYIQK